MELERERAHDRVLVAKREARLALVGSDEVESLELEDVAPSGRDLTVGNPERSSGNRGSEMGYRAAVKNAVTEIAEYDGIDARVADLAPELLDNLDRKSTRLNSSH